MGKILSTISLILALVLFPPASLAVVSNNAVPGDTTYPIKRSLEDVIYAIVSLHPITKAWFSAARSNRRFEEIKILVTAGKSAKDSLQELVIQTDIASKQIQKIQDPKKKKELIANLQQSIEKYDQGLNQIQKSYEKPAPSPTPIVSPPPEVIDIEETREDLDEIKKELEEEKEVLEQEKGKLHQKDDKGKDKRDKREENDDKKIDKEDSDKDKKDHQNKDRNFKKDD